jgi:hypothetical protein
VDVVRDGVCGYLNEDLGQAARDALKIDPANCRQHARNYVWSRVAQQFIDFLVPCGLGPEASQASPRSPAVMPV